MSKLLACDLDGTLLDTLGDLSSSVNYALRQHGMPERSKSEVRRFLGNGIQKLIAQSVPEGTDEKKTEKVLQTFRAYYLAHSLDETAPYEGINELLHALRSKGVETAIVSNKLDPAVKDLHQAFFADSIDVAIGEKPGVKRKPAPDMVNEAIRQLSLLHERDIPKSECIYMGDSEVDMLTAQNSGLPCISVSWGFRDRNLLVEKGAKTIIDRPGELFDQPVLGKSLA